MVALPPNGMALLLRYLIDKVNNLRTERHTSAVALPGA
jgi:hypothetical protein